MFYRKIVLIAALFLFAGVQAEAQAQKTFEVKAKILDAATDEGVGFATITLTPKGSGKVSMYSTTDDKGNVLLKGVKAGTYTFVSEMMGYTNLSKEIKVAENLDLGVLKMEINATFLQGAKVTGLANPINIRKDTIEFNASSFKITDNDMLEDLLKKLPGVEVGSDGSITANGKTISKIYINGKEFFLNDPQLASKNIPANIIDKVKVREKKSDQAEFTGIDDGEEETIIDLSVMKGMMNGWFGNVNGGGGTDLQGKESNNDARFQAAGMVARIGDTNQLAFIGNANNTNNRGFRDVAGAMMGTMRGPGPGMGGQGGGGGMQFRGNGINTTYMTGVNANTNFGADNKSEAAGNYLFSGSDKDVLETTSKTTFQSDGTSVISDEDGYSHTTTYGHRMGARIDWKISENTSILFNPGFNIGFGSFDDFSKYSTATGDAAGNRTQEVNSGERKNWGDNRSRSAEGFLLLRQRLGKPGRTVSLNIDYNLSDNKIDGNNLSTTEIKSAEPEIDVIDQYYNQESRTRSLGGRLSYTEPLGGNFFAEAAYAYNFSRTDSEKNTYDKDGDDDYTILDERYSNVIKNTYIRQNFRLSLMRQTEGCRISVGAAYQPASTENITKVGGETKPIVQNVRNWSPTVRFDYDINESSSLRVRYRGQTTQPTITQLQPIEDNSNPLSITLGNPNLQPHFSHNLRSMFFYNNKETFSSMHGNLDVSYKPTSIINAVWTGRSGVTATVPLEVDKGTFSSNLRFMFNSPIKKSDFSVMSHTSFEYANSMSLIGSQDIDIEDSSSYLNLSNYQENRYQTLGLSEFFRLTYRTEKIEVTLGDFARLGKSWYQIESTEVGANLTNSVSSSVNWTLREVWNLITDCRYTFYKGYSAAFNDPTFVWNAEIQKQVFKRKATVALKCFDILNQSRNTYRTITDNYIQDVRNNTLGRYAMLSFTWRFGNFNKQEGKGGPMGPPPPMMHR
ncbi:MAG: TonB-dependent receptor [Bacteroidales bacterium]|nr:TonB-dependent receptor [Bacteroidales bacterium]